MPEMFCGVWQYFGIIPTITKVARRVIKKGQTIAEKVDAFIKVDSLLLKEQELYRSETQVLIDYED